MPGALSEALGDLGPGIDREKFEFAIETGRFIGEDKVKKTKTARSAKGSDAGSQATTPTQSRTVTPTPGEKDNEEEAVVVPEPLLDWYITSPVPVKLLNHIAENVPINSEEALKNTFDVLPTPREVTELAVKDPQKAADYFKELLGMQDGIWAELLILYTPEVSLPFITDENRASFIEGLIDGLERVCELTGHIIKAHKSKAWRRGLRYSRSGRVDTYHPMHPFRLLSPFIDILKPIMPTFDRFDEFSDEMDDDKPLKPVAEEEPSTSTAPPVTSSEE